MGKSLFVITFLSAGFLSAAQTLKRPLDKPGHKQLVTPDFPKLTKPDLQVTAIRLIKVEVNSSKLHTVTVSVSIKNNGQLNADRIMLKAYSQNQLRGDSPWSGFGELVPATVINGGATVTADYVFHEDPRVISTSSFKFKVVADAYNAVVESNEINNTSSVINIRIH